MVQNIFEVFSSQETKVYFLRYQEGKSIKEIAQILDCSVSAVKTYSSRIKKKINELEKTINITLDYGQEEISEIVEDIFNEENERVLSKKTVNQVQFLAESNRMSSKQRTPEATRRMRRQTGTANITTTRVMTEYERTRLIRPAPAKMPNQSVTSAYNQYNNWYNSPPDIESMATLELILRAHGLIYRTPYINKLNRKTSIIMRAQETGFQVMIVEPGNSKTIPPGSKFIESVKDDTGHHEYSVWLFPKNFCPNSKQKHKELI